MKIGSFQRVLGGSVLRGRMLRGSVLHAGVLLCTLAACADERIARIDVGPSDTLVLNNRAPVRLASRVFDVAGRERSGEQVAWRWLHGDSLALSPDGVATCDRAADARVEASVGAVRRTVHVRCRPIMGFRDGREMQLTVGGDSIPFVVHPVGLQREPVLEMAGYALLRDTSVAQLRNTYLFPRRRGRTRIDLRVGDCEQAFTVTVTEPVDSPNSLQPFQTFETPVSLVAGEYAAWRLPANHYVFTLDTDSTTRDDLLLGAEGFNCAPLKTGPQHYSCINDDTATLVVRNRATSADASADALAAARNATGRLTVELGWTALGASRRDRSMNPRVPRCVTVVSLDSRRPYAKLQ